MKHQSQGVRLFSLMLKEELATQIEEQRKQTHQTITDFFEEAVISKLREGKP